MYLLTNNYSPARFYLTHAQRNKADPRRPVPEKEQFDVAQQLS